MTHRSLGVSVAVLSLLLPASVAFATGVFPDVGDNHPFKGEIEALFRQGVVKGNPSGTFNPDDSVTRAAFLKMLYTATLMALALVFTLPAWLLIWLVVRFGSNQKKTKALLFMLVCHSLVCPRSTAIGD